MLEGWKGGRIAESRRCRRIREEEVLEQQTGEGAGGSERRC